MNDNREYNYTDDYSENRPEYDLVLSMVDKGSSVIDLGCGEGSLMQRLQFVNNNQVFGIELASSGVEVCVRRGFQVIEGRIDENLPVADKSFDVALCNVTIQMVNYPERTLMEMKRVARKSIVISFPNFAYILNRLDMLFKGRMPRKMIYGYKWYNTGHIHQLSIKDFSELVDDVGGLEIEAIKIMPSGHWIIDKLAHVWPNVFGKVAVLKLKVHE